MDTTPTDERLRNLGTAVNVVCAAVADWPDRDGSWAQGYQDCLDAIYRQAEAV